MPWQETVHVIQLKEKLETISCDDSQVPEYVVIWVFLVVIWCLVTFDKQDGPWPRSLYCLCLNFSDYVTSCLNVCFIVHWSLDADTLINFTAYYATVCMHANKVLFYHIYSGHSSCLPTDKLLISTNLQWTIGFTPPIHWRGHENSTCTSSFAGKA